MSLIFKYTLFAVISTAINLFFQWLVFWAFDGVFVVYVAMFFGTIAGLITKYILDKKFIFYYKTRDIKDDSKKFILYSFMGVFTTLIFWGFEISFDYFFENEFAKYIGAILGLTIGYVVKYFLDKRFVFKKIK